MATAREVWDALKSSSITPRCLLGQFPYAEQQDEQVKEWLFSHINEMHWIEE